MSEISTESKVFRLNMSLFRVVILPGKNPSNEFVRDYNSAYSMWKNVWQEFWQERKPNHQQTSDSFLRQDEILAIFYGAECVAVMLMDFVDFSLPANREDGYFSTLWRPEAHGVLEKFGKKFLVSSHTTVHPNWRGRTGGVSVKDLLGALLCERFLESDAEALLGSTRQNLGVTKMAENLGARVLHTFFHEPSKLEIDLIVLTKENHKPIEHPKARMAVMEIWRKRKYAVNIDRPVFARAS